MLKASFEAVDNRDAFVKWVRQAQPGEACLYHVGLLMADRQRVEGLDKLAATVKVREAAVEVAAFADQGFVILTQRRIEDNQYEYLAVRTKKPAAPLSVPQELEAV